MITNNSIQSCTHNIDSHDRLSFNCSFTFDSNANSNYYISLSSDKLTDKWRLSLRRTVKITFLKTDFKRFSWLNYFCLSM